ncbi:MAG: ABC transporter permease [Candidatus Aminicenantes bacterium]|nr:ABC transporter permease [Candidatus Aminicenantes bacterium]
MEQRKRSKPRLGEALLRLTLPANEVEALLGDFDEIYDELWQKKGQGAAKRWYWTQILRLQPSLIKNSIYWSGEMLKNYIKVALRNIKKNKIFSFVNLLGLALGISCSLLIFLYVQHEVSYDRFHDQAEHIYRIVTEWKVEGESHIYQTTAAPVAPALLNDYPEVQKAVRIKKTGAVVHYGDKSFVERGIFMVDPDFLEMFTFPLKRGNPETVLDNPYSLVITENMADKYFGDSDPLGQKLSLWNDYEFEVTGVAANVPKNTHLNFDFLLRFDFYKILSQYNYLESWGSWNFLTYILIQKDYPVSEFEEKTTDFIKRYRGADSTNPQKLYLTPLLKINLETYGKMRYIIFFTAIAVVILLLACVNFMNLSVARSSTRTREIGLRKVIGAKKGQIVKQFLGECLILAILALPAALLLVHLFLPSVNSLLKTNLQLAYLQNITFILGIIGITVLAAFLSGIYPSFYLSSFRPVQSLQGEIKSKPRAYGLRSFLVVFQFTVSIILIICTLTIHHQLKFIQEQKLGFNKNFLVNVPVLGDGLQTKSELVKAELNKNPKILGASISSFSPGNFPNQSVSWEGQKDDEELMMAWYSVDHDFIKTFEIEIVEGRNFSRQFSSDVQSAYILNEAAVKTFGWPNPIGKEFKVEKAGLPMGRVVGVMKDFHFASLYQDIKPLALILEPQGGYNYSIKIDAQNMEDTLTFIEKTFRAFAPHMPYIYSFMDDKIAEMYVEDERLGKLFNSFSVIALIIACMGLLGLASFSTLRRTKEIGIRKILGASVSGIIFKLSHEFTKWVVVANIIAWPVAYFAMNRWLQNFAFRTGINIWVFVLSASFVLLLAIITVIYQAIKAATANPAHSLRYE